MQTITPVKLSSLDAPRREAVDRPVLDVASLGEVGAFDTYGKPDGHRVFHGSRLKFEAVRPYPSTRIGPDGHIDWKGTAMFASSDYRVAVFYTLNRVPGYLAGIDLRSFTPEDKPLCYDLKGGTSLEDALDHIYGQAGDTEGYIYALDASRFHWEKGLGQMECISNDTTANEGRVAVDRRAEIDRLLRTHRIELSWTPRT